MLQVTGALALDAELPPRAMLAPAGHRVRAGGGLRRALRRRRARRRRAGAALHRRGTRRTPSRSSARSRAARENARSIREVVSLEVWQAVNELHVFLGSRRGRARCTTSDRDALYARVQRSTQLGLGPPAQHDAPRRAARLHLARASCSSASARPARMLDVQHHALVAEGRAARRARDGALALAPARVLGLRGVHEAQPGQGHRRRRRRVPHPRAALPALGPLLRDLVAGARRVDLQRRRAPRRARPWRSSRRSRRGSRAIVPQDAPRAPPRARGAHPRRRRGARGVRRDRRASSWATRRREECSPSRNERAPPR